MTVESEEEVEGLARVGAVVAATREAMIEAVSPGITTAELDEIARDVLSSSGAQSAPQLAYSFPGFSCISVNSNAAHGVPSSDVVLSEGDIVNLDVSAELDGYWADTGASVAVGNVDEPVTRLLEATRLAQEDAMAAARAGRPLRHIGRAAHRRARSAGFHVVPNLCGHGIGRFIHEAPDVLSFENPKDRTVLHEGLVLAIEPFLSMRPTQAVDSDDGWTLRTADGSLVAQFEHTVIVTNGKPIVLTAA